LATGEGALKGKRGIIRKKQRQASSFERQARQAAVNSHAPLLLEALSLKLVAALQSFFINPASAAKGLWVALAVFGLLVELSEKYCWSV